MNDPKEIIRKIGSNEDRAHGPQNMFKSLLSLLGQTLLLAVTGIVSSFVLQLNMHIVIRRLQPAGLEEFDFGPYLVMGLFFVVLVVLQVLRRARVPWKISATAFLLASLLIIPFCIVTVNG